jgi:hypothetical protein
LNIPHNCRCYQNHSTEVVWFLHCCYDADGPSLLVDDEKETKSQKTMYNQYSFSCQYVRPERAFTVNTAWTLISLRCSLLKVKDSFWKTAIFWIYNPASNVNSFSQSRIFITITDETDIRKWSGPTFWLSYIRSLLYPINQI